MKIEPTHPAKMNDPLLKNKAMLSKNGNRKRWTINYDYRQHGSFDQLNKHQIDEFTGEPETWSDTKHNNWDIGYNEFYEDLQPANKLTGGVGDATAPHDVDPVELSLGQTIEMEHTTDPDIATEIALDHLKENPKYYTQLKNAGLAKELELVSTSSGFGDPNHPINDKKRLGSDITCTPGNNIVGKIGNTPDGHVEGYNDSPSIIDKPVDIDIEEPVDEDRCYYKAVQVYGPKTSAYRSGAMVKCRQGKIWKKTQEEIEQIKKELEEDFSEEKKQQGLHGWFARRGGKGGQGWVDCNTCRTNPKTGRKTCNSCGRQAGEKRSKYPACRPTPSQCNRTGTSRKKGPTRVSWKPKNESMKINESSQTSGIITGQNPQGKTSTRSSGTSQSTAPQITTGYGTSKAPIHGTGEESERKGAYDFFQYKKDNAKFGNGNIIKKSGRVDLYELAKQALKDIQND